MNAKQDDEHRSGPHSMRSPQQLIEATRRAMAGFGVVTAVLDPTQRDVLLPQYPADHPMQECAQLLHVLGALETVTTLLVRDMRTAMAHAPLPPGQRAEPGEGRCPCGCQYTVPGGQIATAYLDGCYGILNAMVAQSPQPLDESERMAKLMGVVVQLHDVRAFTAACDLHDEEWTGQDPLRLAARDAATAYHQIMALLDIRECGSETPDEKVGEVSCTLQAVSEQYEQYARAALFGDGPLDAPDDLSGLDELPASGDEEQPPQEGSELE